MTKVKDINIVAQNPKSTVVAQFCPSTERAEHYQSEDALEKEFIAQLQSQAYQYITIHDQTALKSNLREQLSKINNYQFSNVEWERFFDQELANPTQSIEEKTRTIQEDYVKNLEQDNGTYKNIRLIDKDNIHNNTLQVINQYATDTGQRSNRYDVTILVNGLPLVHIELKRRGINIQEAFNQINRYQRESFWADSGLFEYAQLFVISNGTHTKYYSNTTRSAHVKAQINKKKSSRKKPSNSFEFTSWWADHNNKPIMDLIDFAKTFFAKHSLLNIITKYCVFTVEKDLLVMRPYQIVATEKILNKIETSTNVKKLGTIDAGGYIWHTTGSGKTLTSFKTAQIASKLDYVKKVLFVVDRKDLDYQTMKEYDKFEKGSANSNTSTAKLQKQLEDPNASIIVTTIQKLDKFIKKNKGHAIFDGQIVLIFDECHRSQFGDMHKAITKSFKNYHLFGFTGTPIFAKNASSGNSIDYKNLQQITNNKQSDIKTTEQAFGEKLHTYTIVDAISDRNVLKFKVDYISTIKKAEDIDDKEISNIDRKEALADPERISNIVGYIRKHFNDKTRRNSTYIHSVTSNIEAVVTAKEKQKVDKIASKIRLSGFNSIFTVSSINMAKLYYREFQKQLKDLPSDQKLKVATIFSYRTNEEHIETEDGEPSDENPEDTSGLDKNSRDFLEDSIKNYNKEFGTSYDTSSDKFQNYYKDVSERVKNRELDILIVVDMFLTGFDAKTLNTLWVDKSLRSHGLIQAFSRTNRILNSIKTHGNIVCFRNLEKRTNEAIALFGDKEASGIVLLKTFDEYYNGYEEGGEKITGYKQVAEELLKTFNPGERIVGELDQKKFVELYGRFLRGHNVLTTFDEFADNQILTARDIQDYHGIYLDLYNEFRKNENAERENINDDLVFEMELIKQIEINIDYIITLIKQYHTDNTKDKNILTDINRAIDSSIELRNKKDLIEQFIQSLEVSSVVDDDWIQFVEKKKIEELEKIIEDEDLNHDQTYSFVKNSFRDGAVATTGTAIAKILPPISRFSPGGERTKKRKTVIQKLNIFFNRFFGISKKN